MCGRGPTERYGCSPIIRQGGFCGSRPLRNEGRLVLQLSLHLKWPYHANVMKILEANSIRTGNSDGGMTRIDILSQLGANTIGGEPRGGPPPQIAFDPTNRKARPAR